MIQPDKFQHETMLAAPPLEQSISNDVLRYYQVFPKEILDTGVVFYASEDHPIEIQLELEHILGVPVTFFAFDEAAIQQLIQRKILADSALISLP